MSEAFRPPLPETRQPEPIVEDIAVYREHQGFTDGFRGTYTNADHSRYLYEKPSFLFDSKDAAQSTAEALRIFTDRGVFHPNTMWSIGKGEAGGFQVLATMPALKVPLGGGVIEDPSKNPKLVAIMERLDPTVDEDDIEGGLFNELSPLRILNYQELSHGDNWGQDPQTGNWYVSDIESVFVEGQQAQAILRDTQLSYATLID